jgi:hypothetical protein
LSTGTGGHTAFGGFGLASRKFGLLLDTVVSADVVLGNGILITANSTQNTDVFWAIRGSAPSFGIVTSWTYQTVPAPDSIGFTIVWKRNLTQDEFVTTYLAYQNFSQTAPRDLGFDGDIFGGLGKAINITFLGFWYGKSSAFNSTIRPFLAQLPAGFILASQAYNWIDGLKFLSGRNSLDTSKPDTSDIFFVKSLQTKGPHTQDALKSFTNFLFTQGMNIDTHWFIGFDCEYLTATSVLDPLTIMSLPVYGANSTISDYAQNATAYNNRDAFITYQFYATSGNETFPGDGISFVMNMLNSLEPNPQAACTCIFPLSLGDCYYRRP